jgi:arsenite methyltransferase
VAYEFGTPSRFQLSAYLSPRPLYLAGSLDQCGFLDGAYVCNPDWQRESVILITYCENHATMSFASPTKESFVRFEARKCSMVRWGWFIRNPVCEENMVDANEKLRMEFNQWATEGRGEDMESHHVSIASQTLARMALKTGDRVLELSCGTGWATRLLALAVEGGPGMAVGLDISDEMIARARAGSRDVENAMFVVAPAEEIPWQDEYFEKALAIESFYYYPDQEAVLREVYRVLAPGGMFYILINLYNENPYSLRWVNELKTPVHARSEAEYGEMLRAQGFTEVEIAHVPDMTETPEQYSGKWFANADELRKFKQIGALLLIARKPE